MLTLPTGRQTNQTVTLETRIASIPWDYVMIIIGMTSHVDLVTHTHTQDIVECSSGVHSCDANAQCTNTVGSYTCSCLLGFNGDGRTCSDIDECSSGSHSCNGHAQCTNAVGTYTCQCNPGYHGDGWACTDIDECTTGSHSCDANAQCTNNMGSHTCQCNHGFHGDGWTCADEDECSTGSHTCNVNAHCINNVGSYTCRCNYGFYGDGHSCTSVYFSVQTNCGYSSINGHSGRFTSPNYPSNYADHQSCYWTLTSNTRITLSFESFILEGCCDYVRVYDGDSTSHTSLGEFNGDVGPPSVSCSSNQMHITFQTDSSATYQGFSAIYDEIGLANHACSSYTEITDGTRHVNYGDVSTQCDNGLSVLWYRLNGAAGTRMPTSCVPENQCDTDAAGWLDGVHPTVQEGIVPRKVCFHWSSNCCLWDTSIRMLNCGVFYVFEFKPPDDGCSLRYCGTN